MNRTTFAVISLLLLGACQDAVAASGKEMYDRKPCSACHNIGAGGAPILGVRSHWAERIKKGPEALTQSVVRGMGRMPPRGATSLSDAEIRTIVDFMIEQGR